MSQIERIYWIDSEIRLHRYPSAERVCEHFEVSRRTAYGDRDALIERLNAPLAFDRSNGGWKYTDPTYILPFLALSSPEAASLARSLLAAREYLGSSDASALELIADKLSKHVPGTLAASWESFGGSIRSVPDLSVSAELVAACERAIGHRQRLHILYYSAHRDETHERTVQPYHLHNHQGEWHLVAWCEMQLALRQFLLGRVRNWRLLPGEGAYEIDVTFDANQYLSQGLATRHGDELIKVRLRFSAQQSRWIRERIYHPSQQTTELPDGRLELQMQVAGTEEVKRWILGYGPEVEVVAPIHLRRDVADSVKRISAIYENNQ